MLKNNRKKLSKKRRQFRLALFSYEKRFWYLIDFTSQPSMPIILVFFNAYCRLSIDLKCPEGLLPRRDRVIQGSNRKTRQSKLGDTVVNHLGPIFD